MSPGERITSVYATVISSREIEKKIKRDFQFACFFQCGKLIKKGERIKTIVYENNFIV